MNRLLDLLREPALDSIDIDGTERFSAHQRTLARKRMLREVFTEFHHLFLDTDKRFLTADGLKIELGAGVAPVRNSYPDVLATDVVAVPHLDRTLDAEAMDLPDVSVRAFYGQNCFHHFSNPCRFFDELERTLLPGGGAILIEPYYGILATFLFKRLFKTEGFDKSYPSWNTPPTGPMSGTNQALSYLVFVRDRVEFETKYPQLRIAAQFPISNYLKYVLSGGLNFKQLLPDWMIPAISLIQKGLTPLEHWLALHHVIVLRKEPA